MAQTIATLQDTYTLTKMTVMMVGKRALYTITQDKDTVCLTDADLEALYYAHKAHQKGSK